MAAASGNSHRACPADWTMAVTVAARIELAKLNGRWRQRVETRSGLAQRYDGSSEWQLALGVLS